MEKYDQNQRLVIQDNSDVILVEAYPGSGKTQCFNVELKD